ncbi:uncharacterized protein [Ptychodera flava]|uniref:uncharacterized protein n=1 Tax=Ptychodera flava TaxID=63121 RepID=UPI00396A4D05
MYIWRYPPPVLVEHNYALPANMEASLVSSPTVSTLPTSRQKPVTPVQAVGVLLDHEEIEHVPGFEDLATKVVKRKIQLSNENREDLIRFKTKGQPFHMKTIRAPRKDNTEVSQKTLQLRAHIMNKTRSQVVGSSTMVAPQLQAELKSLEKEKRKSVLAPYLPEIPEDAGLCLKTEIGLSWSSLRKLRRYFFKCRLTIYLYFLTGQLKLISSFYLQFL